MQENISAKVPDKAISKARALMMSYRMEALCALLLTVMALNFLSVLPRKSITVDDIVHIPAGFYHLHRRFRINFEQPPLVKMLAAFPLLLTNTEMPAMDQSMGSLDPHRGFTQNALAQEFWRANNTRYEELTFWSRVPMIAVALLLGALIFSFTRQLFGARAGLLAVALYTLEPTILANGRVVQTDVIASLAYLLLSVATYVYLKTPKIKTAAFIGLTVGLALVSKFSMLALAPLAILAQIGLFTFAPKFGQRRSAIALHVLLSCALAIIVVNAAYLFHRGPPEPFSTFLGLRDDVTASMEVAPQVEAAAYSAAQRIFSPEYVNGVLFQMAHNRHGNTASLLGMYSQYGWWYYFPIAFALKTTIPFLLLSVASIAWALWRFYKKRERQLLVMLLPFFAFTALSMMGSINIGIRHFLPAYPFLFILSGALLDFVLRRRQKPLLIMTVVIALFGWMGIETIRAFPDYIPYMNELASRSPHWYYLSDSNVEWGDDVKSLALYLKEKGEQSVSAAIMAHPVLESYGIEAINAPADASRAKTRYVAIGASHLNGSTVGSEQTGSTSLSRSARINYFADYRQRQPEIIFGNSIYLYRAKE